MYFQADFKRLHPSFPSAVIIGDFNIDLNRSSHDTDNLLDFCSSNYLFIVPYNNTYYTSTSQTRIDHCFLSDQSLLISHQQRPLSLSMHDLIEVTLDFFMHRLFPRTISIRYYSKFNTEHFLLTLQSLDLSALYQLITVDEKVSIFNQYLTSTRDLHAVIRSFGAKKPPAPWLNTSIRSLMHRRDAVRRAYRFHPFSALHEVFCSLRNEVKR